MVVINGRGGEIKVGYKVCAQLGTWNLSADSLTANDCTVDSFWIEQPGSKTLRLQMKNCIWQWRDADVSVAGTTLFVRVSGSPEQR